MAFCNQIIYGNNYVKSYRARRYTEQKLLSAPLTVGKGPC